LARELVQEGGIAVFSEETSAKRVELMREVVPRAVRLGTVNNKGQ
jgi:putative ABC transport system substrate-binding protein